MSRQKSRDERQEHPRERARTEGPGKRGAEGREDQQAELRVEPLEVRRQDVVIGNAQQLARIRFDGAESGGQDGSEPLGAQGEPVPSVELADPLAHLSVTDDDDSPALAVAAAGREAGIVQDPVQHVVRNRIWPELAYGARAHDVEYVHVL